MWTIDSDGSSKWFGRLSTKGFRDGDIVLTCDEGVTFGLFQGLTGFTTHTILNLPNPGRTILLKLYDCKLSAGNDDNLFSMFPLKTCRNEDILLKMIEESNSFWAYDWEGDGKRVFGFLKDERWDVVYSRGHSVYFPVKNTVPYMVMIPASS